MLLLTDTAQEFIKCFKSIQTGSPQSLYKDVELELVRENNPLSNYLDRKLCPLPYVLATRHREDQEVQGVQEIHEILENTILENTSVEESFVGNPARLLSVASVASIASVASTNISVLEDIVQKEKGALSVEKGRWLLSLYNLYIRPDEEACLPFYIFCDAKDEDGVAVLGVNRSKTQNIDMFLASVKVHHEKKKVFPQPLELVKELGFPGLNAVDTHCTASYEMYKSSVQANASSAHQSNLRILCDWRNLTQPPQLSPFDMNMVVEVEIFPGDPNSAAHGFFRELCILKALVRGVDDGKVMWYESDVDVPVIDRLKQFFTRIHRGSHPDGVNNESPEADINQLVVAVSQNLYFTEELWTILKDFQCYQDLIDGFHLLKTCLEDGSLEPSIHFESKSRLAAVIRKSYTDHTALLKLHDMEPLELLAEIGLEKVTKDHLQHLTSKDLVNSIQLDEFVGTPGTLQEQVDILEKLHYAVDLAVNLDQLLYLPREEVSYGAREVLKYFKGNELENRPFAFKIPIRNTPQKKERISGMPPSEWRATICTKRTNQEQAVVLVTPDSPFGHVQIQETVFEGDTEVDDLYETRITHHSICC